jgi:hypothetical protein
VDGIKAESPANSSILNSKIQLAFKKVEAHIKRVEMLQAWVAAGMSDQDFDRLIYMLTVWEPRFDRWCRGAREWNELE